MRTQKTSAATSLLLLTLLGRATAQDPPKSLPPAKTSLSVHLSRAQVGVFQDAIDSLAQQGHVAIVAEGIPLVLTTLNRTLPDLTQDAPLETTLSRLASAYDYSLEKSSPTVFLLKKRYTDSHDLPGVTLEECALAARDVVKVLSAFALDADSTARESPMTGIMRGIMSSLTPEQMQALRAKNLPVASLSQQQQILMRNFVLDFYTQTPLEEARPVAAALEQAQSASIGTKQDSLGVFFGYYASDAAQKVRFTGFTKSINVQRDDPVIDPAMALPPNAKAALSQAALSQATPPSALTLQREAEALSKRGPQQMRVDAALGAKTISLAGEANADPAAVFKAMAAVYGLAITVPEEGTRQMTRRLVIVPLQVTGIPDAVWIAVPEPLWRALHKGQKVEPVALQSSQTSVQFIQADQEYQRREEAYLQTPATLHMLAIQKIRLGVESFWRRIPGRKPVPITSLTEADREAFAVALMADLLGTIRAEYGGPIPSYVLNFDQAILGGGPYLHPDSRSKWKFALNITVPGADGQPTDGPGGFDMPYFPAVEPASLFETPIQP